MDNKRILIANLSKGLLGADKANLLGAALVSQFELAAMSRANISEDKRRDFFLFIDEFQNFTTDSFAAMLSEARKYRLNLTLSHQYLDQLRPEVRDAVFGNVGSLVTFRVGHTDAERLEREFGRTYSASHLSGLGNYEVCARLLDHGRQGEAFLGQTLAPMHVRTGRKRHVIAHSRKRHTSSRVAVDAKIRKWLNRIP
jgi:hypothetical protein